MKKNKDTNTTLNFAHQMEAGNLKAALRQILEHSNTGTPPLHNVQADGRTVKEHLIDKHPARNVPPASAIVDHGDDPEPHPVMFDRIDGPSLDPSLCKQLVCQDRQALTQLDREEYALHSAMHLLITVRL